MIPALLTLWFALMVRTQTQAPGIPVEQEPKHRVVLKNDFVRVIDATLPPGYVTLHHAHDVDNVSVTIASGRGRPGRASFAKGGYSHTVTNAGPEVMRFIVVEVGKSDHPGSPPVELQNHTLETENNRTRIYRVKLAPGESLQAHRHDSGWVEVFVTGGAGPGATVWHEGGSSVSLSAGKDMLEVVEIEPK